MVPVSQSIKEEKIKITTLNFHMQNIAYYADN